MPVGHLGNAPWVCVKIMKTGRQDELQKDKENNKIRAKETKEKKKREKTREKRNCRESCFHSKVISKSGFPFPLSGS